MTKPTLSVLMVACLGLLIGASTASAQEPEDRSGKMAAPEERSGKMAEPTEPVADPAAPPPEERSGKMADEAMADPADSTAMVEESGEADDGQPIYEKGGINGVGLVVGGKVGGGFGQVTSDLGATFVGELELGYNLDLDDPVNRDLGLFVTFGYAGPSADETASVADSRLPGSGLWTYELTLQQFIITPGLLYRIQVPADWVRPYVAAGPRIYLTKTEISGEVAGQPYGDNEETSTDFGAYGALGADFFPGGPGSILVELQFGWAPIDNFVLQNTNAGSLNIAVGYRLFI